MPNIHNKDRKEYASGEARNWVRRYLAQVRDVTAVWANEKGKANVLIFVYKKYLKKKAILGQFEKGSGASIMSN